MNDRPFLDLPPRRRRALVISSLASFAVAMGAAFFGVARADPGVGTPPVIAGGTSHACALFYDGTLRCWGSNALDQLGTAADAGAHALSTEDQPQPTPTPLGYCDDNAASPTGFCNASTHRAACAWACPSGFTCITDSDKVCSQCASDNDCDGSPGGPYCNGYHVCVARSDNSCDADVNCGAGKCLLEDSICVECVHDSDCPGNGACDGFHCKCGPVGCPTYTACSSDAGGTPGDCVAPVGCSSCPWGYGCDDAGTCSPLAAPGIPQVSIDGGTTGPIGNVIAVAAGDAHTCALIGGTADTDGSVPGGTVWCWGEGSSGQLGTGSYASSPTPVQVSGIGGTSDGGANVPAIALAAGAFHTCALLADGTVKCWGDANQAQLGDGGSSSEPAPVSIPGISGATALAAGAEHTCALLATGVVKCWGGNTNGQAGTTAGAPVTTPSTVSFSTGDVPTAIAAGRLHTCALITTSSPSTTVKCWGYNGRGQLGNSSNSDSASPVSTSLSGVRAVSAGGDHTCALLADGTVKCWGDNGEGQTGNGSPGNASTNNPSTANLVTAAPTTVSGVSGVRAISSGYFHNCAVLDNGTVKCWGSDAHGQRGDNAVGVMDAGAPSATANFGSAAPNLVANTPQIAVGYMHTCVLRANGSASCWGNNAYSNLDNSSASWVDLPVPAADIPITSSGVARGAISLCGGYEYTCALLSDGTAWCWGYNADHETANADAGSTVSSPSPVALSTTAVQLVCGATFACALLSDGKAECWGDNTYGALGRGTSGGSSATPSHVLSAPSTDLTDITYLAAGSTTSHVCALVGGGSIVCWGNAFYLSPYIDTGTYPAQEYPVAVDLADSGVAKSMAMGGAHSCALLSDGTAQCWGDDYYGQLGDNNPNPTTYYAFATPLDVVGFHWGTAITGGMYDTCALRGDGTVWCWGDNVDHGAVGNNDSANAMVPAAVVTSSGSLGGGASVCAGYFDACALHSDGSAHCWGSAGWGQLGNGSIGSAPNYDFPYAVLVTDAGAPINE